MCHKYLDVRVVPVETLMKIKENVVTCSAVTSLWSRIASVKISGGGSCIRRRLYNAYHKHFESQAPTIHLDKSNKLCC